MYMLCELFTSIWYDAHCNQLKFGRWALEKHHSRAKIHALEPILWNDWMLNIRAHHSLVCFMLTACVSKRRVPQCHFFSYQGPDTRTVLQDLPIWSKMPVSYDMIGLEDIDSERKGERQRSWFEPASWRGTPEATLTELSVRLGLLFYAEAN